MSYETKEEAQAEAEKIRKQLGSQWKIRVWENIGWHFQVSLDNMIHVYEGSQTLHVMIGKGGSMLAMLSPTVEECHGEHPVAIVKKAVKAYKQNFDAFVAEQNEVLRAGLEYISA